jgi:broad specificity phosphatase PhoE
MNNTFYLLRHAEPRVKRKSPVHEWDLSTKGRRQAEETALSGFFDNIDIVISSYEKKASRTAKPIADKLGKDIVRKKELNELDRSRGGFLKAEEYNEAIRFALTNLDDSLHGWETALHTLCRFSRVIEEIDSEEEDRRILIVSHGCVLSLYFANLLNRLDDVYERWRRIRFCDWGIVENRQVQKDII